MPLKRFFSTIGTPVFLVNAMVLLLIAIFSSLASVLYPLIVLYVSAKIIHLVVTGLTQRKAGLIIIGNQPHW